MDVTTAADQLHSLAIRLLRHARVVDAATGMSAARLSTLSVLVFGGPRTVTELAAAEQVATPTMTRLLQGLEADDYVRRTRDAADARVVRVHATRRGRAVLVKGRAARVARLAAVLERLPASQRRDVARLVSLVSEALSRELESE